jgi:type II secretory pathway component PulK
MGEPDRTGLMKLLYGEKNVSGSVLLYVLWILVVISLLAFKLSSASRVVMIKEVSEVAKIKKDLQIASAIRFASLKIINNEWKDTKFEVNLNNQRISIEIFNEAGYIPVYDLSSGSLKTVLENLNINLEFLDALKTYFSETKTKFNDFYELSQFEGISNEDVNRLVPFITIYNGEPTNPNYSPGYVLMKLQGVDQYRVGKLIESSDIAEKDELRKEIVDILKAQNFQYSEAVLNYYRVYIRIGSRMYWVFLKFDQREKSYIVVNTLYPDELAVTHVGM